MSNPQPSLNVPPAGMRVWSALLTGLPFAVFKIGGGIAAHDDVSPTIGWVFIVWGITDVGLNLLSVFFPQSFSYCVLSNLGRIWGSRKRVAGAESLALAGDTFFSGAIVATMILLHRTAALPTKAQVLWEWAVVVSVLAAGVERVAQSYRQLNRRGWK